MTDDPKYRVAHGFLMLVVAVALIGWLIPFAIANYRLDDCTATLHARLDAIKAKINDAQGATRAR
jgi:hypothetical protein